MRGLLVYVRSDYEKNKSYAGWLINEFKSKGVILDLKFEDEIINNGIEDIGSVYFLINRSRNYNISLMAELNGIRVFNNSKICLLGNNKLFAYKYAKDKNYLHPRINLDWGNLDKRQIISKTTDGHGGSGVALLSDTEIRGDKNRFQQELIKNIVGDIRFYVIDNKIIHAVLRTSNRIVSNFSQGGNIEIYNFNSEEEKYIEDFINDLEVDYAGIDFFLTKDNKLIFNEIEDVVGSRMLSKLNLNNTTELFVNHVLNKTETVYKIKILENEYKQSFDRKINFYEESLALEEQQEYLLEEIEKLKSSYNK